MRTADSTPSSTLRTDRLGYVLIVLACAGAVLVGALLHFKSSPASHGRPALVPLSKGSPPANSSPAPSHASVNSVRKPMGIPGKWTLILDSDFKYGLDTSLWRDGWFGTGGISGPVNKNENACYSPRNISLPADGTLHLDVTADPSRCLGERRAYTGAIVTTNPAGRGADGFQYRYGAMQARVFIPRKGGLIANWPTVMTLGQVWPKDGEDDVLEGLNGVDCLHFHSPGFAPGGTLGGCDPGIRPGWHTIASNWEPGSVTWYYDGVEVDRVNQGVTSAPMYLVLLNTVSQKGRDVSRPDTLRVAYVRVWQHPKPVTKTG
jgi:hypothetical protein